MAAPHLPNRSEAAAFVSACAERGMIQGFLPPRNSRKSPLTHSWVAPVPGTPGASLPKERHNSPPGKLGWPVLACRLP